MSKAAEKRAEVAEAKAFLREVVTPGQTVYVVQRHVSRSGMERRLSLFLMKDNKPHDITKKAALAMGSRFSTDDWTLKIGGCGMNMHFAAVYNLSSVLFPDGHPCTGETGCPSNDHSNDYGNFQREFYAALEAKGEPNLDYYQPGGAEQHAAMSEYVSQKLAASYDTSRVHSDGGYALNYSTL